MVEHLPRNHKAVGSDPIIVRVGGFISLRTHGGGCSRIDSATRPDAEEQLLARHAELPALLAGVTQTHAQHASSLTPALAPAPTFYVEMGSH